jgi:hypothetical protein
MGANAVTTVPVYVAGEVLTAADLNITNSGIPVFADSTARTAAFGGTGEKVLAEGQYAYLESDNSTSFWNGSAWQSVGTTPGLIPIAPTSVGKTGASSTATASTNGQVTFALCETLTLNGVFTSAYSNYRIIWAGLASAGAVLLARLAVAGTANSNATYNYQAVVGSSTSVTGFRGTSDTKWNVNNNISTAGTDSASIDIFNPQATKNTSFTNLGFSTASGSYIQMQSGYFTTTTSFDGIQFLPDSGNISGTVSVYGYNQ